MFCNENIKKNPVFISIDGRVVRLGGFGGYRLFEDPINRNEALKRKMIV